MLKGTAFWSFLRTGCVCEHKVNVTNVRTEM